MSKDVCAPSKTTQHNTPITQSEFTETVTVIDPRHPLYGQTFRLIQVENRPDRGECCLVEQEQGQNRYIPLDATDQGKVGWVLSSLPLSVQSIRQLVSTYTQLTEGEADGSLQATSETITRNSDQRRMVAIESSTENTGSSSPDSSLPDPNPKGQTGKSER